MKFNQLVKTSLLSAGAVVLTTTAQAVIVDFTPGDLVAGFFAPTGTGSDQTYLFDLGPATSYRDQAPGATFAVPTSLSLDLIATFGANWATRSDLYWGIFGVANSAPVGSAIDGDPVRTLYASRALGAGGARATPWGTGTIIGSTARGSAATQMATVQNSLDVAEGTTNSGNHGALIGTNVNGSFEEFNPPGQAGTSFSAFNPSILSNFGNGAAGADLDVFRILNNTTGASPTGTVGLGSYEGTFSIDGAGVVTYTNVPEPTSFALLGAAAGLLGFARRRKVLA